MISKTKAPPNIEPHVDNEASTVLSDNTYSLNSSHSSKVTSSKERRASHTLLNNVKQLKSNEYNSTWAEMIEDFGGLKNVFTLDNGNINEHDDGNTTPVNLNKTKQAIQISDSLTSQNILSSAISKLKMLEISKTENLNKMNHFKICFAGDYGIGKTRCINRMLSSPDITGHEEFPPALGISIQEVRASTKPDPLQFNLTITETPGYSSHIDTIGVMDFIIEYHKLQFKKTLQHFKPEVNQDILQKFVSHNSGAHTHVDVCIYGLLHRITVLDVEYMRRLSKVVVVVPVILKADTLSSDQVFEFKVKILETLKENFVELDCFRLNIEELLLLSRKKIPGSWPFALSSFSDKNSQETNNDEYDMLRKFLFVNHTEEIQSKTAEKFIKWFNLKDKRNSLCST